MLDISAIPENFLRKAVDRASPVGYAFIAMENDVELLYVGRAVERKTPKALPLTAFSLAQLEALQDLRPRGSDVRKESYAEAGRECVVGKD